ncbi:hypothetical protein [Clostridium fallax]|uniref:BofC C-terminal domain-containing protein n=1 Tax=Clostridium fallax TaxID=1533 RepID=A0A1M4UBP3_9CLOT|nr:hypothetical protein [Clostridium fallax]SHE53983.1 hypothetical protein SAMN05443638_104128 [Clostridium fallax]SQB06170.1 Uncharacterised protein [Clostridium fallax]
MKKKNLLAVSFILGIIIVFILSYNISNKFYGNNQGEDKAVNTEVETKLSENTLIVLKNKQNLKNDPIVEKQFSVEKLKENMGLKEDITKEKIIKYYSYSDYKLVEDNKNQLVFLKDSSQKLVANKYYVGEKEGYLTIYKTNKNGDLIIENEKTDIFKDIRKINDVNEDIQEDIKNFKKQFDSKEEAEEYISLIAS